MRAAEKEGDVFHIPAHIWTAVQFWAVVLPAMVCAIAAWIVVARQ